MRPAEFPVEAIVQAGQDLQEAGRNITGFALRKRVGGGSPNRLKQVWDEHVAGQASTRVEPPAELPVEVAEEMATVTKDLTDRLTALAVGLNDKAVKAAERRVGEVVRAAGEQREQAERELIDASQAVDELEASLDQERAQVLALTGKLDGAQSAVQTTAIELAQLRERLAASEAAARAAAEQHSLELAKASSANVALGSEIERLKANEMVLATSIARAEAESKQSSAELLRVTARAAELADSLRSSLDEARGQLAAVTARAEAEQRQHAEQRKLAAQEVHRLTERMNRGEAERDEARRQAGAVREEVARLRGQVDAIDSQRAELTKALAGRVSAPGPAPRKGTKS